jgi:hypothetical protein
MAGVIRSEMPDWECQRLLADTNIGRLCVLDDGYPLAFPVNFQQVTSGGRHLLVVRVAPGASIARCEGRASLEADHIDQVTRQAWSVIARGVLRRVSGFHDLPDPGPWIDDGRSQWMTLEVSGVSGRRFRGEPTGDGFEVDWVATSG